MYHLLPHTHWPVWEWSFGDSGDALPWACLPAPLLGLMLNTRLAAASSQASRSNHFSPGHDDATGNHIHLFPWSNTNHYEQCENDHRVVLSIRYQHRTAVLSSLRGSVPTSPLSQIIKDCHDCSLTSHSAKIFRYPHQKLDCPQSVRASPFPVRGRRAFSCYTLVWA